jgi:hypothetical protein
MAKLSTAAIGPSTPANRAGQSRIIVVVVVVVVVLKNLY